LWGQVADVFGRYNALQSASLISLIGTIFSAFAPLNAFPFFLVGRALQGAGSAGLLIIPSIIIADKVSLKEHARNNTTFTLVAGIGYGLGPVIGGFLTKASWRYVFIINIPLGVLGIIFAHFFLRKELLQARPIQTIDEDGHSSTMKSTWRTKVAVFDLTGQLLFLLAAGLFVLSLTWAGSEYAWDTPQVVVPLVLSIVSIAVFGLWEYSLSEGRVLARRFPHQRPMLPLHLLKRRNCSLLLYVNLSSGMATYAVFYFTSLYLVLVQSFEVEKAGRSLMYYMPGLGVGALMAMRACNVWPMQTFWPLLLGSLLEPLGITLAAVAINNGRLPLLYGMLAFVGVGSGVRQMPGTLHGVGYFPEHISTIVSLIALSQSLGSAVATTLMLNIFNSHLTKNNISFSSTNSAAGLSSVNGLDDMASSDKTRFQEVSKQGIVLAFFGLSACLWLGLITVLGLGNVYIQREGAPRKEEEGSVPQSENENENEAARRMKQVTKGSYAIQCFRSQVRSVIRDYKF
jgi:hypothetical protein